MHALESAWKFGGWVLLQNIHLTIDWTTGPLEKRVDKLADGAHPAFRCQLTIKIEAATGAKPCCVWMLVPGMQTKYIFIADADCALVQVVPVGGGATYPGAGTTNLAPSGIYQAHKRAT